MKASDGKKRKIIIISCIAAAVCLAAIVTVVVSAARRNSLAKGLLELSEELTGLEAEMGEHFWTDAVNQIGSENMQAKYSLNIGGIPELDTITVGIDGKCARDMEKKLCNSEVDISVANARLAEAYFWGTEDTLYLQVPTVWEGNVVLNAADLDGQWNGSALKEGLQLLTGQDLEIACQLDADLFRKFSVSSFSLVDFLEENEEALRNLYESMETVEIERAKKEEMLEEDQVELLKSMSPENAEGEKIETTCYLVILSENELRAVFHDVQGDIRLCIYLDSGKRIVRIASLPSEKFTMDPWKGNLAINLTGTESVTDRVEVEIVGESEGKEAEETIIIEKEVGVAGAYQVKWEGSLADRENTWKFSLEGSIRGERVNGEGQPAAKQDIAGEQDDVQKPEGTAAKLSIEVENFVLNSEDEVVCRGSGSAVFAPFTEKIQMPAGREYRIAEMNEWDTALFLMECTKNVNENYSGYLRFLQ